MRPHPIFYPRIELEHSGEFLHYSPDISTTGYNRYKGVERRMSSQPEVYLNLVNPHLTSEGWVGGGKISGQRKSAELVIFLHSVF